MNTPTGPKLIRPDGWPRPSGYADAISTPSGRTIWISGQVGWNPATSEFESDDFATQCGQALRNVAALLSAAGAAPSRVARLTWYVTNREEYVAARADVGRAYREVFGAHYPAMSVVVVAGLVEERAKVEIEATAVIGS